ncbi:hypothetical protein, partial [Pseudomonas sp. FR229a]|uniref:hypothetical protein n=1 Tax=Pseudomonas sp. FR229a TaxID=3040313 RepID=UPI00255779E2
FRLPFWRLKKVTRRKGGTLSSRYRSNGYVLTQKAPHRLKKNLRAGSLLQGIAINSEYVLNRSRAVGP